jgi:hypothetical protein
VRGPVLSKISKWQISVTQLIHKFSENAKVLAGVDGHMEENVVNYADAS